MANILLADDDAAVRDLVSRALKSEGHSVHATEDGAAALDHFKAHAGSIDLLVSDVDMPQLDGIALVREVLKLSPGLRVVMMSGFSDQLDKAQGLSSQHLASISKPFTLEQIKLKVRAVLS